MSVLFLLTIRTNGFRVPYLGVLARSSVSCGSFVKPPREVDPEKRVLSDWGPSGDEARY